MDEKKTRFNFLDVLIVIAVLALISGIIWRQELSEQIEIRDSRNTVTVKCEFELVQEDSNLSTQYGARFEVGNTPLYMNEEQIGFVENTVKESENSSLSVETVLLKLTVVSNDSGYYLENGSKVFLGGVYRVHTKTQEFTVRINSIKAQ